MKVRLGLLAAVLGLSALACGGASESDDGSAGSAGMAGGSGGSGGSAGSSRQVPEECKSLSSIVLEGPQVADDDGDGLLEPGESATLTLSMVNHGADQLDYPAAAAESLNFGAKLDGNNQLYGILAGQSVIVSWTLVLSSELSAGDTIGIRAWITNLEQSCQVNPFEFELSVD